MPDQIAALGDVVDGALLAGAVEPASSAEHRPAQKLCLNCGTALAGPYCHSCGQAAHVHRHLMAIFHDLLHGVFHFEGKVWRTLPILAWQPGRLTREYIDGHRARYVSPIALFLFSVFLLFAAARIYSADLARHGTVSVNGKVVTGLAANEQELSRMQAQRSEMIAHHRSTADIDGEIAGRQQGIAILRHAAHPETLASVPDTKINVDTSNPALKAAIERARANPALVLARVEANAHKYSWALIVLSVPFVWLLFPFNRRFGLYDHTVFVTYSISAAMLLFAIFSLASRLASLIRDGAPLGSRRLSVRASV